MLNLHQYFSFLFLFFQQTKCYIFLTPFPSEKPLCLWILHQIVWDPLFEILGECTKACCIVKVISTQSSAVVYGDR